MAMIVRREEGERTPLTAGLPALRPFRLFRDLLGWDPFREMEQVLAPPPWVTFIPDIEVKETSDAYLLRADVPGVRESDLEISVTGSRLTISGKREEEKREEGESYFACERAYGSFTRSFTLPDGADMDRIAADLKDGVLTVTVPKRPGTEARKIAIGGAKGKSAKA